MAQSVVLHRADEVRHQLPPATPRGRAWPPGRRRGPLPGRLGAPGPGGDRPRRPARRHRRCVERPRRGDRRPRRPRPGLDGVPRPAVGAVPRAAGRGPRRHPRPRGGDPARPRAQRPGHVAGDAQEPRHPPLRRVRRVHPHRRRRGAPVLAAPGRRGDPHRLGRAPGGGARQRRHGPAARGRPRGALGAVHRRDRAHRAPGGRLGGTRPGQRVAGGGVGRDDADAQRRDRRPRPPPVQPPGQAPRQARPRPPSRLRGHHRLHRAGLAARARAAGRRAGGGQRGRSTPISSRSSA